MNYVTLLKKTDITSKLYHNLIAHIFSVAVAYDSFVTFSNHVILQRKIIFVLPQNVCMFFIIQGSNLYVVLSGVLDKHLLIGNFFVLCSDVACWSWCLPICTNIELLSEYWTVTVTLCSLRRHYILRRPLCKCTSRKNKEKVEVISRNRLQDIQPEPHVGCCQLKCSAVVCAQQWLILYFEC